MNFSVKISTILLHAVLLTTGCTSIRRGIVGILSFDDMKKSGGSAADKLLAPTEGPLEPKDGFSLKPVASSFDSITDIKFLPGESDRAVILEKSGTAYLVDFKSNKKTLFLKVSVETASELGLLGLAFHPDFASQRKFYLHYNPRSDLSRISEWKWLEGYSSNDSQVLTKETRTILEVDQPYQNHNGGNLVFGPDKMLYIGFGDGGWRGDPENRAQNLKNLLGKMLRIDIDQPSKLGGRAYGIPKDNPFLGKTKAEPEIFAYGLRNPWKYSFDSRGRLVVADVGQDKWEEISIVPPGGNMGWRIFEASHCYESADSCDAQRKDVISPIAEYGHSLGSSVTGGFQYAGKLLPSLVGRYVFGDFITGRVWSVPLPDKIPAEPTSGSELKFHGKWDVLISTFAQDAEGEMYVADFSRGTVYLIVPNK